MKYMKKSEVVQGFQWLGADKDIPEWFSICAFPVHNDKVDIGDYHVDFVNPGEYITLDNEGDLYHYSELEFWDKFVKLNNN